MSCASCGAELQEGKTFCGMCGARAAATGPEDLSGQATAEPRSTAGQAQTPSQPRPATGGQEIADRAKLAWSDMVGAIKLFALNPTGGLAPAYGNLTPERAIGAGIALGLLFDICLTMDLQRWLSSSLTFPGPFGVSFSPPSVNLFNVLVYGAFPFVGVALALFKSQGTFAGDLFVAGAALFPWSTFFLASAILGSGNLELIAALALFALSYSILILFTGCTKIYKMAESASAAAVPFVILVSGYAVKVLLASL